MQPYFWQTCEMALATPDWIAPTMKCTFSRVIMRSATRVPVCGVVSVSIQTYSIWRPSTPPLALNSSIAMIVPRFSSWPLLANWPLASWVSPILIGLSAWAYTRTWRNGPNMVTPAAALPSRARRVMQCIKLSFFILWLPDGPPAGPARWLDQMKAADKALLHRLRLLVANGLEVSWYRDLDDGVVVGILEHRMLDPRLLIHTGARLHDDLADTLEVHPRAALEHINHLEVQGVVVDIARALAGARGRDHVRPHLAFRRIDHPQVAVFEIGPQALVPVRVPLVRDVVPALGKVRVEPDPRAIRLRRIGHAFTSSPLKPR